MVALGEIADLRAGVGFPLDLQGKTTGKYPLAKVGDISRAGRSGLTTIGSADHFVDDSDLKVLGADPIPAGSILFAKIGEAMSHNHRVVTTVPMLIDNNAMAAVPDVSRVSSRYLYHVLRTIDFYRLSAGKTVPSIRKSVLQQVPIPLPPLAEQKRIAAVLDKADDLRGKRRQALATLDTLLQSVFLDMFGDPVTNPKGWPVVTLGEISTKITDGVHLKPNYMPSGVPFISVKDVSSGRLIFEKCKYVSQEDHEKMFSRCNPERGDILYTKVGTYGIPVIVDSDREFSLYVSVALVKPERSRVDSMFLREAMAGYGIRRQAVKAIKGIGVPDLHLVEIRKFRLPLPPLTKQQEFCRRCDSAIRMRDRLIANQEQLDTLFAALQSAAFAGTLFNGEMVKAAASKPARPAARPSNPTAV
jgi:type I restriction enzyme S subunit